MATIGYYRLPPVRRPGPGGKQEAQLQAFGCSQIFLDRCSALAVIRPGLDQAFDQLGSQGVLVAPSFHALAGTIVDLLTVCGRLLDGGHELVCLKEQLDTRSDAGFLLSAKLLTRFNLDRGHVRRVEAEMVASNRSLGGRPALISNEAWASVLPRLKDKGPGGITIAAAAQLLNVSYDTVARKLRAAKD